MPFVPVTNVARFAVEQTVAGEKAVNVFWVRDNAGWTAQKMNIAAGILATSWVDNLASLLAADWTLDKIVCQDYTTYNGASFEFTPGVAIVGTGSGDTLPPQVALVVSWRTANRGRSFRGRTYLCGFTEFYQDNGRMSSSVVTPVLAWANQIRGYYESSTQNIGVVSFMSAGQPRQVGLFTQYSAERCNGVLYTQRRRTISVV